MPTVCGDDGDILIVGQKLFADQVLKQAKNDLYGFFGACDGWGKLYHRYAALTMFESCQAVYKNRSDVTCDPDNPGPGVCCLISYLPEDVKDCVIGIITTP